MAHHEEIWFDSGGPSPVQLRLVHYPGGDRAPVLIAHGATAGSDTFVVPRDRSLTDYLLSEGFDVWLLDWRASKNVQVSQFTLDTVAANDHPRALAEVRARTGRDDVRVLAHCMGSATFSMTMALGLAEETERVVLLTIGLFYEVTLKVRMLVLEHIIQWMRLLGYTTIAPQPHCFPLPMELIYRVWPFQPDCRELSPETLQSDFCHRLAFMFGLPYLHANLTPDLHDAELKKQFGTMNMLMYSHCTQNVRRGFAARYDHRFVSGLGRTVDHLFERQMAALQNVEEYGCEEPPDYLDPTHFAGKQITLITGQQNRLWLHQSVDRMYRWLCDNLDPRRITRHVLPRYGHQDLVWGVNAQEDVFPLIVLGLDGDPSRVRPPTPHRRRREGSCVFVSDFHMTAARSVSPGHGLHPYNWLSRRRADHLASFFRGLGENRLERGVRDVVLLGDVLDCWVVPSPPGDAVPSRELDPADFADVLEAPQNREAVAALRDLAAHDEITVHYVPGNHDMLLTPQLLQELSPGIRDHFSPSDGPWPGGAGVYQTCGGRIVAEHGHAHCIFNAPDPEVSKRWLRPLPLGYFAARLACQKRAALGEETDYLSIFARWLRGLLDNPDTALGALFLAEAGDAGLEAGDPVFVGTRSITVEQVGQVYALLNRRWRDIAPDGESLLEAYEGDLDWLQPAAHTAYLSAADGPDVVVFGHTHRACLQTYGPNSSPGSRARVYANTGAWIDSVHPCTYVATEQGDEGHTQVRLMQYGEDGEVGCLEQTWAGTGEASG